MPLPGNLYSAEDSDGESFSEELSPSDGYFNRGEVRRDLMVPDPSLDDKKVEDKTLIPTPHPQATTGRTSRSSLSSVLPHSSSSRPYASPPSSESSSSSLPNIYNPMPRMSSRRPASFSEHNPLMNIPPPAYSESPESSLPNSSQDQSPLSPRHSRNESAYSTFQEQNLERGFLPLHEPQSMGGPIEVNERTPLSGDKPGPSRRRLIIKKLLFIALVFAVILALACAVFTSKKSGRNPNQRPGEDMPPSRDRPVDSGYSYCPSATHKRDQVIYEFPVGADLTVLQTTHDNDGPWGSNSVKTTGEVRLRRIPKDSEHGNRAFFTVDIHVSDPQLEISRTWDEDSRRLQISTPKYAKLKSPGRHCISLEITAWFPEDAELSNLVIEAITLTLRVFEDLKIKVDGRSIFTSLSGDVYFPIINGSEAIMDQDVKEPEGQSMVDRTNFESQGKLSDEWWSETGPSHPFSSRRIVVETVSGSINGFYPLLDDLIISTQSGDVSVGVLPQEALKEAPAPADIEVQTASGSIKVDFPIKGTGTQTFSPPARNYITNVHSSSGSIDGTFYLGSLGSFKSTSGSIQLTVLPVTQASTSDHSDDAPLSRFETHTVSGSHDIQVLDPIFISRLSSADGQTDHQPQHDPYSPIGDDEPYIVLPPNADRSLVTLNPLGTSKQKLRNVQSKHTSNSASVQVSYPSVWQGTIHAKTVSGDIEVSGKGIRTIRERKGWAYKEVLARKGVEEKDEGSYVEMSDIAGSLRFKIR
ncbi:hypothetical protein LHYA1_G006655 [Lachnellula hyalina]|uniref:DUF4097 domain-containing protein n=1 Tax=Lachnellula hyalina TaxID=1316788 RepID=A0A8H8QZ35_9HELO|nr:uncharacterized protein LHYA1_G006655 [Lachnellula hyalina]TVY24696.1 hypothetical protein LHYA1_G006655 [Lachnellula hyalina]